MDQDINLFDAIRSFDDLDHKAVLAQAARRMPSIILEAIRELGWDKALVKKVPTLKDKENQILVNVAKILEDGDHDTEVNYLIKALFIPRSEAEDTIFLYRGRQPKKGEWEPKPIATTYAVAMAALGLQCPARLRYIPPAPFVATEPSPKLGPAIMPKETLQPGSEKS